CAREGLLPTLDYW
nr:immunoglobulin heavy chain junction region [Mus musculus]MBK4195466.1 immunoglobulin heavy chain junction region [Mus musculus]